MPADSYVGLVMDYSDASLSPQDLIRGSFADPRSVLCNDALPLILLEDASVYQEIVVRCRYGILAHHFALAFGDWHYSWPYGKKKEAVQAVIECFGDVGLYRSYIRPLHEGRLPSFVIKDVMSVWATGMEKSRATGELLGPAFYEYIEVTDRIARVYPPLEPEALPHKADFPW